MVTDLFIPITPHQQTQEAKILEYMKQGNSITALDALNKFGSFRLASRISDLKKKGYQIQSKTIRTDIGKHIKKYWIGGNNGY